MNRILKGKKLHFNKDMFQKDENIFNFLLKSCSRVYTNILGYN